MGLGEHERGLQRDGPGILTAAVNAVLTQFADYHGQLQDFAQGAQGKLLRLEQSVAVISCFFGISVLLLGRLSCLLVGARQRARWV